MALATAPAFADSLKDEAERLCHAYIGGPQDFKAVETRACRVTAIYGTEGLDARCFEHSVEGSSQPQRFASFPSGGTCSSSSIAWVDDQNHADFPNIRNSHVNGYGFGGFDSALDYQGELLITNGRDLRLAAGQEQVVLCMFMYKLEGWQAPEPAQSETCQKFSRNEFSDRGSPISEEQKASWPPFPEASPVKQVQSDLDGDGKDELVLSYHYVSGAGCGCDANPLVLFNNGALVASDSWGVPKVSAPPALETLGGALDDLTMTCDARRHRPAWSVVRIDGKDFVLADYEALPWTIIQVPAAAGEETYSWSEIPDRELYQFQGDKFVRMCVQKPIVEKVIAHDVIPQKQQTLFDYTPLE